MSEQPLDAQVLRCELHPPAPLSPTPSWTELLELWDRREGEDSDGGYTDAGSQRDLANWLSAGFGCRAANLTFFRLRDKGTDRVVTPTWFTWDGKTVLTAAAFEKARKVFRAGQAGEDPERALPEGARAVLLSDGEVSFRCLQYLWREHAAGRARHPRAWLVALGLLADGGRWPTVRLARMLAWLQHEAPSPQVTGLLADVSGCLQVADAAPGRAAALGPVARQPHPAREVGGGGDRVVDCVASVLDGWTHGEGTARFLNVVGHMALRCSQTVDTGVPFPPSAQEFVSQGHALDPDCCDRSIVVFPIASAVIPPARLWSAEYLGSHVGVSAAVLAAADPSREPRGAPDARQFLLGLRAAATLVGAKPLAAAMLQDVARVEGETASQTTAHYMKHEVKEAFFALVQDDAARALLVHPDRNVQLAAANALLARSATRRLMVVSALDTDDLDLGWNSPRPPTAADWEYWRAEFRYMAARLLFALARHTEGRVRVRFLFRAAGDRAGTPAAEPEEVLRATTGALAQAVAQTARFVTRIPWPTLADSPGDDTCWACKCVVTWLPTELLRNALQSVVRRLAREDLDDEALTVVLEVHADGAERVIRGEVTNACAESGPGGLAATPSRVVEMFPAIMALAERSAPGERRYAFEVRLTPAPEGASGRPARSTSAAPLRPRRHRAP